jgi:hypothetical protein
LDPTQNEVAVDVIVGTAAAGYAAAVTAEDVARQPRLSIVVTLYVPGSMTVIDGVVAPVDQA